MSQLISTAVTSAPAADPVEVVTGFLRDVRSGRALHRAADYLSDVVVAHQGPPGSAAAAVRRTPEEYAEHVRDMDRELGPWDFEVLDVASTGARVVATWRQVSTGAGVVERAEATYRVDRGRIAEYWIDAAQQPLGAEQPVVAQRVVDVVRHVAAPPSVVWRLLADVRTWAEWGPWDTSSDDLRDGVPVRVLRRGRTTSVERVLAAVPEDHLSYALVSGLPLRHYRARVTLHGEATGTVVRWHASFDRGARSALLRPLLHVFFRRVLRALAAAAEHEARLDRAFGPAPRR